MSDRVLFEFDAFRLDPAERLLRRDGELVSLEPKVFETLLALVQRGGRLVSKEELMAAVWPDSFVEESNLTRNISVLRKVLQQSGGGLPCIETVPKRGYRFVAAVRTLPAEATELTLLASKVSLVIEQEESDEGTRGNDDPATPQAGQVAAKQGKAMQSLAPLIHLQRNRLAVVLALAGLLAGVAAIVYLRPFAASRPAIDSIAVLPFMNVAADPNRDYLSDGITDSLINTLAQLPGLKVMSRNAVFRYKGREADAQAAAKELGVRAVLAGRIAPQGDGLRVSAELIDARDNSHLWGGQYLCPLTAIQSVQAEISRDVSEKLRLRLSGEDKRRLTKRETDSPQAYELYLKGRYALNALTNDGPQQALEYFRRATEADTRYAPAYAGMAEAYSLMGNLGATFLLPPKEAYSQAKAAALEAIGIDETLAEAHTSLAIIAASYEWDWGGAEREFKRAIALNPNYHVAHHEYSHFLISMARFDESLAESQHALALDPLDVGMTYHLGFHYYNARQYDQAIAQLQKALEMKPNHSEVHGILGLVYEQVGRFDEAAAELNQCRELGGVDTRGNLGHVYAVSGRRDEARKLLAQLQEETKQKSVSPYNIARIYEGLGEKEPAFAWLERAYAERDSNMMYLKVDPEFDRLRADPRLGDLLRRIGLMP